MLTRPEISNLAGVGAPISIIVTKSGRSRQSLSEQSPYRDNEGLNAEHESLLRRTPEMRVDQFDKTVPKIVEKEAYEEADDPYEAQLTATGKMSDHLGDSSLAAISSTVPPRVKAGRLLKAASVKQVLRDYNIPPSCLPKATIDLNKTSSVLATTKRRRSLRSTSKLSNSSNHSG